MQYVYILRSEKDGELYTGCTTDLKKRLILHNAKKVPATKKRVPLKLIHYEAFQHPTDAFERERYLKTQWGRNYIRKTLRHFFNS